MKMLIIAAHPDDEVLGCGGTIAKLSNENEVYTLILGEGVTSRNMHEEEKSRLLVKLKDDAMKANKILGVKEVRFEKLSDNKFDTIALLDIVKLVEKHIQNIKPDIIYTHHHGDLNIDHQITQRAVITAARPVGDYYPRKILEFETLSSTEWQHQNRKTIFIPNTYEDISNTINKKLEAMHCYEDEIREYPHPRSIEGIKIQAQKRGMEVGIKYAEAFYLIREIK